MLQLNIDQTEFIVHTDSEYNSYVHPHLWSIAHSCVTLWFIVYTLHLNCDYWSRGGRTQLGLQLTLVDNFNQLIYLLVSTLPAKSLFMTWRKEGFYNCVQPSLTQVHVCTCVSVCARVYVCVCVCAFVPAFRMHIYHILFCFL